MKKIILYLTLIAIEFICRAQTVTDIDGNLYDTVIIGTQTWLKENLKVTRYNDGTPIPLVADSLSWINLTTPGYCYYNNDSTSYAQTYGALYNWYAVRADNLCPEGWHVPTDAEWTILVEYLGGDSIAGGMLKDTSTVYWGGLNVGATNESGFTALPGGLRTHDNALFVSKGYSGVWWSATAEDDPFAWYRYILSTFSEITKANGYIKRGYSVRCVKNITSSSIDRNNTIVDRLIYPNPAGDRLYLKNDNYINASIIIFGLNGEMIINKPIKSNYIDVSNLTKGIYLVKIIDSDKYIISRFIKE